MDSPSPEPRRPRERLLRSSQSGIESLSSSVCFVSSYFITFIFFLKLPTLTSGQFSVIGPAGPIQASLGGEAELPCYLSPPQSAQHMEVIWLQSARVVHLFQDGEDHFEDQDPNYQGRTELVRDAITSGNVTLKIRDVKLLDAGKYTCLVEDSVQKEQADMELKILGEEPDLQISPERNILFFLWFGFLMFLVLFLTALLFSVSSLMQRTGYQANSQNTSTSSRNFDDRDKIKVQWW